MSAICGAIDLEGGKIPSELQNKMRTSLKKCAIDRYEEICEDNVFMSCGIQYFTPEAEHEILPYAKENIYFTADVVLDNRADLFAKIGLLENNNISDGELLYKVYKKFGHACLNDLLGAYTFVWYDKEKEQIDIVLDAVGNRCLYYKIIGRTLFFSSLMEGLEDIEGHQKLNDRWLTDFLAMDHLQMINEAEETPLAGVFRIAPAQVVTMKGNTVHKESYWSPLSEDQSYWYDSEEVCKKSFQRLWKQVVEDVIPLHGETAIMLSGGLDSTAVAAVAAPYLKERGKTLYAFTSVPVEEYQWDNSGYYIENEKEDVLKTAEFYGNIETNFVDLDGKNPWELSETEMKNLEMPYKSIQNCEWLMESSKKASEKGARIILSGSYGNTTISFTNLNVYFNSLYKEKKYRKMWKEIKSFSATMGFSPGYALKEIYHTAKEEFEPSTYLYRNSYVNRDQADKMGCRNRLVQMEEAYFTDVRDFEKYRKNIFFLPALRQIGELHTKHSLQTGVLVRDPTRDKRIIDFCSHIPMDFFCKEGVDRRLVKEYLKEIMPPHVIRFQKQGRQSADLKFRISKDWESIRMQWMELYDKYEGSKYVNSIYAKRQLMENAKLDFYSQYDLVRHMYTLLTLIYEKQFLDTDENESGTKENKTAQELISVIIPVYNNCKELQRCVESVCEQSYKNIELILIDDGSTDGSGELCDKLAEKEKKIRVIRQSNQGVSAARNAGLRVCKGDYITFVDSDDTIDPEMYQKLYQLIHENNAQIACCGFKRITEQGIRDFSDNRVRILKNKEMLDTFVTGNDKCLITPAVWNKLFKKELIGDIRFSELKKYEDAEFVVKVLEKVNTGVFINRAYYNYMERVGSLSYGEESIQNIRDFISASRVQNELVDRYLCRKSREKRYMTYFCLLLDTYCEKAKSKEGKKLLAKEMRSIQRKVKMAIIHSQEPRIKDKIYLMIAGRSAMAYTLILKLERKYHKCVRNVARK